MEYLILTDFFREYHWISMDMKGFASVKCAHIPAIPVEPFFYLSIIDNVIRIRG